MADGRCIMSFESNRILNDMIMSEKRIAPEDNYSYRKFLQEKGPDALSLPFGNAACGSKK
jgi:hypothetical protein